jgi:hypothetical protein
MAYIIALVAGAIYTTLGAGTYADAAAQLQYAEEHGGVFSAECNEWSVYLKVRTFVLYIQGSDECRRAWLAICKIMIPLDVDIR